MIAVLTILGIATGESRMSICYTNATPLTEQCSEKYANKLIGKRDIKDALKRLDKLTHEEAQLMTVTAQNLKAIHTVGKTEEFWIR
jgi:hypothetical protein